MVTLLEKHSLDLDFDYSSTQLLGQWMSEFIEKNQFLSPLSSSIKALGSSSIITRGLGQSEIWTLFKHEPTNGPVSAEWKALIERAEQVQDPSELTCIPIPIKA